MSLSEDRDLQIFSSREKSKVFHMGQSGNCASRYIYLLFEEIQK